MLDGSIPAGAVYVGKQVYWVAGNRCISVHCSGAAADVFVVSPTVLNCSGKSGYIKMSR
jgi:hypothetical protein